MPTIKVKRPYELSGMVRFYPVVLDGQVVGKVAGDSEVALPVKAGDHELHMKVGWCRSNSVRFAILDNETIAFECTAQHPLVLLYYIVFDPGNYLKLRQISPA